jgi:hypothetical protein
VAAVAFAALVAPSSSGAPSATVHLSRMDPIGAPTATTSTTALYSFSSTVSGKPVRWNPCAPIHWRYRTTYSPSGGSTVARAAVARIAYLTGTTWVFDGATTATPTSSWLPTSTDNIRPVLIGFTDGSHSDLLRNRAASVLGVTRTAYFTATVNGSTVTATKAAVVALDRTNSLPMSGAVSWKTVLLHELSHAMGLDHVGNTHELMYPTLQHTYTDLQYGDRMGLSKQGRASGCINLGF